MLYFDDIFEIFVYVESVLPKEMLTLCICQSFCSILLMSQMCLVQVRMMLEMKKGLETN